MLFGTSNPTILTLASISAAHDSHDQAFLVQGIWAGFSRSLGRVLGLALSWWQSLFGKRLSGRRRAHTEPRRRPVRLPQTDFELLAAYPVDRANPPMAQRLRFIRLHQSMLHQRLYGGTTRPEPRHPVPTWEMVPLELIPAMPAKTVTCASPEVRSLWSRPAKPYVKSAGR